MLDSDKIFKSISKDTIVKLLVDGYSYDDIDNRTYDQREKDEYKCFMRTLKRRFTKEQIDEITTYMELYIITIRQSNFSAGVKCGAKLLYELIKE